jgi:hypothetical protein
MRFRVVAPIVDSGPPPTVWRRGKWVLRTGRLSPADKGVNMKLEAPWGRGLSISTRVAILYAKPLVSLTTLSVSLRLTNVRILRLNDHRTPRVMIMKAILQMIKFVTMFICYHTNAGAEEITGRLWSQMSHSVSAAVLSSFPHVRQRHDTGRSTSQIVHIWSVSLLSS